MGYQSIGGSNPPLSVESLGIGRVQARFGRWRVLRTGRGHSAGGRQAVPHAVPLDERGSFRVAVEYLSRMTMQRGAYPADRVSALSGVPLSTVHDWARKGILVPSVSAEKVKLWSFADLMGLRIIYWLRQLKKASDGTQIPRSGMSDVKRALSQLDELDLGLWSEDYGPSVNVDRSGDVVVRAGVEREVAHRQRRLAVADEFDVTAPFVSLKGSRGPDPMSGAVMTSPAVGGARPLPLHRQADRTAGERLRRGGCRRPSEPARPAPLA